MIAASEVKVKLITRLVVRFAPAAGVFERVAIELAVRHWARSNKSAAGAVEQVDAARLKLVAPLYRSLGFSPAKADARALLFYSFLFGQSLLLFSTPPARRKTLLQACAAVLIPGDD